MQVPAGVLAGAGVREEVVGYHAEEVAGENGADEGLVARGVERGCFGGEEYQLDDGADGEEDDGAAVAMTRVSEDVLIVVPGRCGGAGSLTPCNKEPTARSI